MESGPPRRSRRKPPSGGSLPLVPIVIGVVVLGFVIGAGLSVAGRHASDTVALESPPPIVVTAVPSDVPTPIPAVLRTAPPESTSAPTATPTRRPTPRSSARAVARPAESASAAVVATAPSATPAPPATSAPLAARATLPAASPSPNATQPSYAKPVATPSLAATAVATPQVPASAGVTANGTFPRLAGNVVRQYLLALARGDTESAYAVLGDGSGSKPGSVPETGALDASMRIQKIEAHGTDAAATVDVSLTTASGPYYGQYTVAKSATGAAIIVSHTFGKP